MKKFGTKTRNTIAITLILTFAFMFVPIQHMTYAEEDLQSTQETQNKGYLESYTEMYGWEQIKGIQPLTAKNPEQTYSVGALCRCEGNRGSVFGDTN